MSHAVSSASLDAPYLANTAEIIEQMLSSGGTPMDTACGLLATDPSLLLHLVRRVRDSLSKDELTHVLSLRELAKRWLDVADHSWYSSVLPACHSALSVKQREKHHLLCTRAAVAAGLIGEWSLHDLECMREEPELAELQGVMAVLPSMLQLCRIEHGDIYGSLEEERASWTDELGGVLGNQLAEIFRLNYDESSPASVAIEIASASVEENADELLALSMSEWSRRLSRSVPELQKDIAEVGDGLALLGYGRAVLKPERAMRLVGDKNGPTDEDLDCDTCRQNNYENALLTVRNRVNQSDATFSEILSHVMHAICNCGTLRRSNWYLLDEENQLLQSRRRKAANSSNCLASEELKIEDAAMFKHLIERPRFLHVTPELRREFRDLLPQENAQLFTDNYLCASVFCGSTPVGVLYADADEGVIGDAEIAKFKAVVSLASKTLALLAMRKKSATEKVEAKELLHPQYVSFGKGEAANESEDFIPVQDSNHATHL